LAKSLSIPEGENPKHDVDALEPYLNQLINLFDNQASWWVFLVALVATIALRVVLFKLFKLALNVIIFALIYLLVIVALSYLVI
jgi:ABC-type multidrug transport system fused ATPase/permease subunit